MCSNGKITSKSNATVLLLKSASAILIFLLSTPILNVLFTQLTLIVVTVMINV